MKRLVALALGVYAWVVVAEFASMMRRVEQYDDSVFNHG